MIWFKRLAPFVILIVFYYGYGYYSEVEQKAKSNQADQHAEVTAKLWLASAYYRNETDRFIIYRDSILARAGLSLNAANEFLNLYSNKSEQYRSFSKKVAELIDSLSRFDKNFEQVPELSLPGSDSL